MRVLVVCEDPTYDQFIVKPVVEEILASLEKPRARVEVLRDPHLRGIDNVLAELPGIVADNSTMVDLFVVIVDRDCDRKGNSRRIETSIAEQAKTVACLAIEEVETWMLCLHRADLSVDWSSLRGDCDVKEHHALPFLQRSGFGGPGRGRKTAMSRLRQEWRSLLQFCPEVRELCDRIVAVSKQVL